MVNWPCNSLGQYTASPSAMSLLAPMLYIAVCQHRMPMLATKSAPRSKKNLTISFHRDTPCTTIRILHTCRHKRLIPAWSGYPVPPLQVQKMVSHHDSCMVVLPCDGGLLKERAFFNDDLQESLWYWLFKTCCNKRSKFLGRNLTSSI